MYKTSGIHKEFHTPLGGENVKMITDFITLLGTRKKASLKERNLELLAKES